MGWQPGRDDDPGTGPGPARDPVYPPSPTLAAVLEAASGSEWRCPGATRDEMLGLLRQAQALECWAAAVKAGVLRSLIRDDDQPLPGGGYHGDLPEGWTKSLTHEVALALSTPAVSADKLMWVAWDLQARLPGIGRLLAAGQLTYAKAKVVHEAFLLLSDEHAASAEAMILADLPGKTYGQVKRLAEQAAITVDPESATRRRRDAEQNRCRVELFREDSGAVALSGRDLPTDEALAAHAHVCVRAQQYKDSGAFPGDTGMDQFRVAAYLDLLNSKPAEQRIASGLLETITRPAATETDTGGKADTGENAEPTDAGLAHTDDEAVPEPGTAGCSLGDDGPDVDGPDDNDLNDRPAGDGSDDDTPGGGGPGKSGPGGGGPGRRPGGGSPGGGGSTSVTPPRLADLVLPLATLLGLAERPGESHALGPLDPALCRQLALAAIGSRWTRLCVTVTDPDGIAIGHGCGRPPRTARTGTLNPAKQPAKPQRDACPGPGLPAQVNLTITAGRLAELAATGPPGTASASWSFTRASDPGPPGGHGTWTLTLPDGRQFTAALEPMPTFECDHRHESHAYQPNDRLRHLVQVRDYTCTFPACNRHAKDSDFEHCQPYDQGGRTCACNAGARSRACHQVKQAKGWQVTQPKPGWHQWQTPSGRVYVQAPKRYPI
jgi:hypothetical protein